MDRCLICHRKLRDKDSIERGMGPTCWRRVMKVVKEDKKRKKARKGSRKRINGQITFFDNELNEEVK